MQTSTAAWLTALILCGASVASGETGDHARRGLYVGAGAAYVIEQFERHDAPRVLPESPISFFDIDSGDSWGAEARAGYRFHPNIAAEGQLHYYDNFGIDLGLDGAIPSRKVFTLNGLSFMANLKGYPCTGRVQPYGLVSLGLLWLHAQARSDAFADHQPRTGLEDHQVGVAWRVGVGIDGYLTRNLLVNVEASYLLPTGGMSDFRMVPISLGVQYRFD